MSPDGGWLFCELAKLIVEGGKNLHEICMRYGWNDGGRSVNGEMEDLQLESSAVPL